jgi:hypothetical protein|tara:strand:- start:2881 stop:3504 length:624 start_codon:yes stop_codon:yes gene_type:complete
MISNRKWLDMIKDKDFFLLAQQEYDKHLNDQQDDYTLHKKLAKFDWTYYMSFDPEQKTFFTKEKKGVVRPDSEQSHVNTNVMGEHHFRKGERGLEEIKALLGLDYCDVTLNNQASGNQVGVHVDLNRNLFLNFFPEETKDATVSQLRKYIVFLQPWDIGQVFCLGASALTQWAQGDVIEFPWYMPHYTANCSKTNRSILFIAGVKHD